VKIRSLSFPVALIALIIFVFTTSTALAQNPTPTPDTSGITADRVNEVARGLWCPLCSGVRLDACELKACIQMKDMIAIKLAEGASEDEIKAYFAEQYGPQVFGEPPREDVTLIILAYKEGTISLKEGTIVLLTWGFNWLAWILPVVVLLVGGYFAWSVVRRMTGHAHPMVASTGVTAQTKAQADDYSQRLEQELSRYD